MTCLNLHSHPPTVTENTLFFVSHTGASILAPSTTKDSSKDKSQTKMPSLHNLPYDLLLAIAQYVDLRDIHALQLVSFRFSAGCKQMGVWVCATITWGQTCSPE
jgi:hypothetical protein